MVRWNEVVVVFTIAVTRKDIMIKVINELNQKIAENRIENK